MLNCVFFRSQIKPTTKKQLSQKGRKSRKQDSSAEEDEEEDDDEDDTNEEDTPKRQTRRRGATKVKRCLAKEGWSRKKNLNVRLDSVLYFISVGLQLQRGPA